jgi:hypothetical protein
LRNHENGVEVETHLATSHFGRTTPSPCHTEGVHSSPADSVRKAGRKCP